MYTYISLFSSGGVGCYGFKQEGYECVATVEKIERRLRNQIFNNKCKFDTGYIANDISLDSTKELIFDEIKKWNLSSAIDVVIATPPCQGMSTANSKKKSSDIYRNSLVVESISIINKIKPKFFVFENVPAFMKTKCIVSDETKYIGEYIYESLGKDYNISFKIINFKDYGVPSSRRRCLVIGSNSNYFLFITLNF